MKEYIVKIKTLTPIWTGDENGKNTTLRETGILGSLRWWYEALIRGLGGTACDPTDTKCNGKDHCDACELFGCTCWSRKFRLEAEKLNDAINLRFIEMREIKDVELALLNKVLTIISEYGAIGGKIAQPSNGLIEIKENDLGKYTLNKTRINEYLKKKGSNVENPNISLFIFVKDNVQYLAIKEIKNTLSYLKGQQNKAKRYFYKTYQKKPNRFFAYGENKEEYKKIEKFLQDKKVQFISGISLLEGLK